MTEVTTIWILEDDIGAQFVYEETLGIRYQIENFNTVDALRRRLTESRNRPGLIIADLRLPDQSFLSFLNSKEASLLRNSPFLVVSSVDDLDSLRFCFSAGAS